ncbi:MAG: hypothetical protein HYS17_10880 [Micavibrio aeruginosavorus]|uniref:Uncharacterized protein n=1 Tax=Micavibrio aeruginosavorus TaxID=349221 RepID=A0A7T5UHU4_9BACT|nr:MAG: hypothetical protein HYS17_10880 [Micavibrio aeruginosavorus]
MPIPTNLKDINRATIKEALGEVVNFTRLALSGKPMISVRDLGDGRISLTEGYFGSKTAVSGLRFEDLPQALEGRMISEEAAIEAFRFMVKRQMLMPANENR